MKRNAKKIFATGKYTDSASFALLVIRIGVGIFMLTHGTGKLVSLFSEGPVQFADPIGIGATASLILAVFAEFLCSILLILGFATRLSAIPPLITMLVAVFIVHGQDPFGSKELASLYSLIYIFLIFVGAGKYSIDQLISKDTGRIR